MTMGPPISQPCVPGQHDMPERHDVLPDNCPAHQALERTIHETRTDLREIKAGVDKIVMRLGSGDVTFATLSLRVAFLEKLVYGAVCVALVGLATAILSIVIRGQGG